MGLYSATSSWNDWLDVLTPEFRQLAEAEEKYILVLAKECYRFLEVGTGTGRLLAAIAPHVKEAVGVEHEYLQVAEADSALHGMPNARVVYTDATDLPFEDGYFDLTASVFNTLGNQGENKFRILKEKRRVTKPYGRVVASVYAENAQDYQMEQYRRYQEMLKQNAYVVSVTNIGDTITGQINGCTVFASERFPKDKLARLFKDSGFNDFEIDKLADFSYVVNARK